MIPSANNFQDYVKEAFDHLTSRHYRELHVWCNQLSGRKSWERILWHQSGTSLGRSADEILEVWAQIYRKLYTDASENSRNAEHWKSVIPEDPDQPVLS